MDEDNNYSYFIEDEFQIKDCNREEQLRHIRELEEKRNLQEQREIELERIQRQIVNKLNIADKSSNETESNNAKSQTNVKPNSKQNEVLKSSRTDIQMSSNTAPKNHDKRKLESYKTAPFHSERNLPHNFSPYFKGTSYRRDGFHNTRQRRPHRASRARPNYRQYTERTHNQNRPTTSNSQHEFGLNDKEKVDHREEQQPEGYSEFEFPPELIPTNVEEEEEMLQEAIELSKQQMFIEKLEKRELDKAVEETKRNQEAMSSSDGRRLQKQFSNRKTRDVSKALLANSDNVPENKQTASYNKQKRINQSVTNSKSANTHKIQKPEISNDKQNVNVTTDRNSYHRQGTKSRHLHQPQKKPLDTYKQNSSNRLEPSVSRSGYAEQPVVQPFSDKSTDYDINSSNWKECARKNLKQLLHLDNSPEASVGAEDVVETSTELLKTDALCRDANNGEANTRSDTQLDENSYQGENYGEKFSVRHSPKCHFNSSYSENENNYSTPIKCSDCFRNYGTRKAGNRSRMNDRRYPRSQHNSRPNINNNTNDSESVCVDWKPYPKLAGEGRTDSIPPRFRKKYQQIIS